MRKITENPLTTIVENGTNVPWGKALVPEGDCIIVHFSDAGKCCCKIVTRSAEYGDVCSHVIVLFANSTSHKTHRLEPLHIISLCCFICQKL